jgi:cytochrome c553
MNYILRGIGVLAATAAVVMLAATLPPGVAHGDGNRNLLPPQANKAWQAECGSCHVAYPPALLPKASWQKLMGGLDRHFGEDASLDPATRADILRFLEAHAGKDGKAAPRADANATPLRITETTWFRHEHDEVPRAAWSRKSVGSAANCAACHRQAEQGRYDEGSISIPK